MNNQINDCLKEKMRASDTEISPEYKIYYMPSPFCGLNNAGQEFSTLSKIVSHINPSIFFISVFISIVLALLFELVMVSFVIPRELFNHSYIMAAASLFIAAVPWMTWKKTLERVENLYQESKKYKNSHI